MGKKFNPSLHIYLGLLGLAGLGSLLVNPWGLLIVAFMLACAKWIILDIQQLWFMYCRWYNGRKYGALAQAYEQRLRKSDYAE